MDIKPPEVPEARRAPDTPEEPAPAPTPKETPEAPEASKPTPKILPAVFGHADHSAHVHVAWFAALLVVALVAVGGAGYFYNKYSNSPVVKNRTVQVTGQATLKAEPDELVFTPYYAVKNADKQAALAAIASKSKSLVDELKKLGVAESAIKTNSSGSGTPDYTATDGGGAASSGSSGSGATEIAPARPLIAPETNVYNLQLTVTVTDKTQAQKVQDYLATTGPSGSVTPSAGFSTAKRKELESKARDEATKDARAKADQSAKNLGFSVGSVKTVTDGTGFSGGPIEAKPMTLDAKAASVPERLQVLPGENDFSYSVTVVYFVR